jgi:hypothetical protein
MSTTLVDQLLAYGLSQAQNGWIALAIVFVLSGVQAYAAGSLGVNPYVDFAAVAGGVTGLLAGPLNWLDEYLQSNVGLKPAITVSSSAPTTPSQPIVLPDSTKSSSSTNNPQPKQ